MNTQEEITGKDILKALTPVFVGLGLKLTLLWAFRAAARRSVQQMAENDPELRAKLELLGSRQKHGL